MSVTGVNHLSAHYGHSIALDDVSFQIETGDFVGLAGPNGAGKTTLIKTLFGLLPHTTGEITLFDTPRERFSQWEKIGYLPQKNTATNPLFPATVEEVVLLGLISQKQWPKRITAADRAQVRIALDELGIGDLRTTPFGELSGGQHQRVILARALVQQPELLIFDEPSTALDPKTRDGFFHLIRHLNQEKRITILFITHDTAYIQKYANKILYLDRKVMYYGTTREFFRSDDYQHLDKQYHIHYSPESACV